MKSSKLTFIFAAATLIFGPSSYGVDIEWSGYGTTGVIVSDSEGIYAGDEISTPTYSSLTRLGLSAESALDQDFRVKAQVISRGNFDTFATQLSIMQLSWQPSSKWHIRAGQLRLPLWMHSDYIDVGVVYPQARLPDELYRTIAVEAYQGISATYSTSLFGLQLDLDFYGGGGRTESLSTDSVTMGTLDDLYGTIATFSGANWSYRIGYSHTNVHLETVIKDRTTYTSGVNTITEYGVEVIAEDVGFFSTGLRADLGRFVLNTEYANLQSRSTSIIDRYEGYYVLVGRRMTEENYLVFAQYSRSFSQDDFVFTGEQETLALGLNYKINPSLKWKVEYRRLNILRGPAGFTSTDPLDPTSGGYPDRGVNMGLASLDFAF